MYIKIDAYGGCIQKYGEELCGDQVKIIRNPSGVTAILADGLGGGTKAGLMTSFTAKMMETMCKSGVPIGQAADMIVEFQPESGKQDGARKVAFTLIQIPFKGTMHVEQFDTPDVILLRRGKPVPMQVSRRVLCGKTIRSGAMAIKQADTVIAVGSGMLGAAAKRNLKNGWRLETLSTYMQNAYHPRASAEHLVRLLLNAGNSLSFGKPEKDLSAMVFRLGT